MRKRRAAVVVEAPTPEQRRHGVFDEVEVNEKQKGGVQLTLSRAYRRRPMIDILHDQHVLTDEQHKALKHYRHHADIADRSPLRDSLRSMMRVDGGDGPGPGVDVLNAQRVVKDCENAAGSLAPILRAVVVYDQSLSDWAMSCGGSIEECEMRKGKRVCRPKPRELALRNAKQDIQFAASRVQAELDA